MNINELQPTFKEYVVGTIELYQQKTFLYSSTTVCSVIDNELPAFAWVSQLDYSIK